MRRMDDARAPHETCEQECVVEKRSLAPERIKIKLIEGGAANGEGRERREGREGRR